MSYLDTNFIKWGIKWFFQSRITKLENSSPTLQKKEIGASISVLHDLFYFFIKQYYEIGIVIHSLQMSKPQLSEVLLTCSRP